LCLSYSVRRPLSSQTVRVDALIGVDLRILSGTTVALVGESGSGKSTLARCVLRLERPTAGEIRFAGQNLLTLSDRELLPIRSQIHLIFQDPASTLNPRLGVADIIAEPLVVHGRGSRADRMQRVKELMEQVELPGGWLERRPLELSGGQKHRVAIARALALQPRFLVFDEALTGLDPSLQAQMINLLLDLRVAHRLTYLFITHDLSLAGHFADEVAVMHEGRIVEHAATANLVTNPQHAQSRALLAAMPVI
jgi:ABC-type glutathione transport system ATPase component